jgi:hypothetical protein
MAPWLYWFDSMVVSMMLLSSSFMVVFRRLIALLSRENLSRVRVVLAFPALPAFFSIAVYFAIFFVRLQATMSRITVTRERNAEMTTKVNIALKRRQTRNMSEPESAPGHIAVKLSPNSLASSPSVTTQRAVTGTRTTKSRRRIEEVAHRTRAARMTLKTCKHEVDMTCNISAHGQTGRELTYK